MSDRTLSAQQLVAIDAIVAGSNQQQTAAAAGVERHTIKRWQTDDALFIAELNSRQYETQQQNVDRLRRLGESALDVLENALASDDEKISLSCAMQILRMLNLSSVVLVQKSEISVGAIGSKLHRERIDNMLADLRGG